MNSPSELCGVGAVFERDASGQLFVHHLLEGGSADRSGEVNPGDVLVAVGDVDIEGRTWHDIRPAVMGPAGSIVRLRFRRGNMEREVRLMRGTVQFFELMESEGRVQAELIALRSRLQNASDEIHSLEGEVEMLRQRQYEGSNISPAEQLLRAEIDDCVEETRKVENVLQQYEQIVGEEKNLRTEMAGKLRPLQGEVVNLRQLEADLEQTLDHMRQRHLSELSPLEARVSAQESQIVRQETSNNNLRANLEAKEREILHLLSVLQRQYEREQLLQREFREVIRRADDASNEFELQTKAIGESLASFDDLHFLFFDAMKPPPDVQRANTPPPPLPQRQQAPPSGFAAAAPPPPPPPPPQPGFKSMPSSNESENPVFLA